MRPFRAKTGLRPASPRFIVTHGDVDLRRIPPTPRAGVPVTDGHGISRSLKEIPSTAFTIFLLHTPDVIEAIARERDDLFCAGHTHGGQIALPFCGALVTLSEYGKRFEAGLHRVGDTWIYVNRGIGMEGGRPPRVRFWARPEVTVIEVVPAT